jgi:hypothetical protein
MFFAKSRKHTFEEVENLCSYRFYFPGTEKKEEVRMRSQQISSFEKINTPTGYSSKINEEISNDGDL